MKKIYCANSGKYRKFRNPKISHIFKKNLLFLLFGISVAVSIKECLKKENDLKY